MSDLRVTQTTGTISMTVTSETRAEKKQSRAGINELFRWVWTPGGMFSAPVLEVLAATRRNDG